MSGAHATGKAGEAAAASILKEAGYDIIATNYHSRYGEIDIIAEGEGCVCFVEVKTRRAGSSVSGTQAVTPAKQRKIITTALIYLQDYTRDLQPRFDVISLVTNRAGSIIDYIYLKGAFDTDGYYK